MQPTRPPIRLSFDRGTLLLTGFGRDAGAPPAAGVSWVWDDRISAWRCEAIHYASVRDALRERLGDRFRDEVPPPKTIEWPRVDLPPLRPAQRDAVAAWRAADGRGQVIMPTGTGKTEVALAIMAESPVATLVVAPVRDLMYQWHRRILRGLGYNAGVIGDAHFNVRPVSVTTYDSAYLHMGELGASFGLIVFDEAHHLPGRSYREAALFCAAPRRLALTATPERSDGLHADLDRLVGPVVYRQGLPEAAGTVLADYDVVRIPVALNAEEQAVYDEATSDVKAFLAARRKEAPDYDWEDLCADAGRDPAARRAQRAFWLKQSIENRAAEKLRVLEDIFRLHVGERAIVFAGSNAMALDVSRRFLLPTILSHTRKKERLAVLEGLASGRFPVLVANQVLDEGVDVPAAKVAVVIGGQASTRQAKQRLGRILRKTGGARATLYEVVTGDTRDEIRSRRRRQSDAYERTRHRRV